MQTAYIAAIQRTAVAKAFKGGFRHKRPDDLLADAICGTLKKTPIPPEAFEDVLIGCAMPEAEQGLNIARNAALLAGLPKQVPAMTINRFCSSGLQTIAMAADRIALGQCDVILAGGVESMSRVPMGGHKPSINPRVFDQKKDLISLTYGMGTTGEKVAKSYQVSRRAQDEYALESHRRACDAMKSGAFDHQILPVKVKSSTLHLGTHQVQVEEQTITIDEGPRAKTSLEQLSALKPVFDQQGTITAGNSSQVSDGAAVAVVVSEAALKRYALEPLARFCGFAVAGVDPALMGIGPIAAVPKVLQSTGLCLKDMDWIELNEAFAAQTLAVIDTLKMDPTIVNPQGGAIALGHPLGATGTLLTAKCLFGLQKNALRYGMVTLCIAGGMGAAGIFERLS